MPIEEIDADDSDRRFDPMAPRLEPADMRQRHGEANRPVAAHSEVSDIVEENHGGGARRVIRLAEERADERVVAARLVDGGAAEMIELAGEGVSRSASGPAPSGGPPSTMTRVGSPSVW